MTSPAVLSPLAVQPTTVAVAPTPTTIFTRDTRYDEVLTVQVENLDGSQDFTGTVQRRLSDSNGWATSSLGDFLLVPAGGSVVADLDVRGTRELRLVGEMSGAGGNVRVTAVRRSAQR